MRSDIDKRKEEIVKWLKEGIPRVEVARRLRCKSETLKLRLDKWGCSHLKNQSRKCMPHPNQRIHVSVYLEKDGIRISSAKLKAKLFRDGYKDFNCELCGISEWRGKTAPLELDHANGNRYDNRLENLRILCPNCHAQQPTNAGKNMWNYTGPAPIEKKYPVKVEKPRVTKPQSVSKHCQDCRKEISPYASRCKSCTSKKQSTKIEWPSIAELENMLEGSSYVAVSKILGVSDNAIRKRLKNHRKK